MGLSKQIFKGGKVYVPKYSFMKQGQLKNPVSGPDTEAILKKMNLGTSLVAQWLGVRLLVQGTRV